MQQQMHHRAIVVIAEVMRLSTAAAYQIAEVIGVLAVSRAVAEDFSGGAEEGQAAQVGQRLLKFAQQRLLFVGRLRLFDDR